MEKRFFKVDGFSELLKRAAEKPSAGIWVEAMSLEDDSFITYCGTTLTTENFQKLVGASVEEIEETQIPGPDDYKKKLNASK